MTEQETREVFKKAVISAIHQLPYEEAIKKELKIEGCICVHYRDGYTFKADYLSDSGKQIFTENGKYLLTSSCIIIGLPITIGRVMQAIKNKENRSGYIYKEFAGYNKIYTRIYNDGQFQIMCDDGELDCLFWKLTKENGEECTDDDQDIATIEKLLNLLT